MSDQQAPGVPADDPFAGPLVDDNDGRPEPPPVQSEKEYGVVTQTPASAFEAAETQAQNHRFELVPFDKIKVPAECPYLVKNIMPREGLAVIWGPPKCGKTFWLYDLSMCVALGWEYRGRRVVQGPVVYVACEGERGLGARTEAYRRERLQEGATGIPFYLVTTRLDLIGEYQILVNDIRAQIGATEPVLVVIDTLNRSINGSETDDMPAYVKAVDAVREAFNCTVAVIHHCGIDGSRPRGHTSLSGATEAQIAVKKDGNNVITCTVEYMKDGSDGDEVFSTLRVVEVGDDEYGDPITSCVVDPVDSPPAAGDRGPKLTPNQETMLNILADAGPAGMTVEEWNDAARSEGIGVRRRADLSDIRRTLKSKKLAHSTMDRWYITHN